MLKQKFGEICRRVHKQYFFTGGLRYGTLSSSTFLISSNLVLLLNIGRLCTQSNEKKYSILMNTI